MDVSEVVVDDFLGRTDHLELPMTHPREPIAECSHLSHGVAHKDDGLAVVLQLGELLRATPLEGLVADSKHFVDEEDVGIDVDGDRET